jgi:hypothetical protein
MLQSAQKMHKKKKKKDSAREQRETNCYIGWGGIQSDIHIDISGETI